MNWILDADIRGFFDAIDHGWLMKVVEHRTLHPYPEQRLRGRPAIYVMPEPIDDTPENVTRACMQGPPKKDGTSCETWVRRSGRAETAQLSF